VWTSRTIAFTRPSLYPLAVRPSDLDPNYGLNPTHGVPFGPAGCGIWDVGRADAAQHRPVSSRIPTLVLAGEYDPAVPPFITRQIPPTLRNSFFYKFRGVGHLQLAYANPASACARSIAVEFLRRPRRRPDSSCMATVPPFNFTPRPRE
jgi:pimeloyl-ACP methyl ester carboxylesterase